MVDMFEVSPASAIGVRHLIRGSAYSGAALNWVNTVCMFPVMKHNRNKIYLIRFRYTG